MSGLAAAPPADLRARPKEFGLPSSTPGWPPCYYNSTLGSESIAASGPHPEAAAAGAAVPSLRPSADLLIHLHSLITC